MKKGIRFTYESPSHPLILESTKCLDDEFSIIVDDARIIMDNKNFEMFLYMNRGRVAKYVEKLFREAGVKKEDDS